MKIAVLLHTTFTRFRHAKRTIESFAKDPIFKLYISDTGAITIEKLDYYRELEKKGHKVFFTGWDTSPAMTRNFLMDHITENYVLKMDDDFDYTRSNVNVKKLAKELDGQADLGLIGFAVESTKYKSKFIFNVEIKDGIFYRKAIPPKENAEYINCHITPDIWIAKRKIFPECAWDERYHVSEGLHTDFFSHIALNTKWRVKYAQKQVMYTFKHEPDWEMTRTERLASFYNGKRFRGLDEKNQVKLQKFCNKWGVKRMQKL